MKLSVLYGGGTINLLKALLMDNTSPMLQHSAGISLGKIASYSAEYAQAICSNDLLPQLVFLMQEQSVRNYETFAHEILETIQKECVLFDQIHCQEKP
jgi:hypothetical protein